MALAAPDTASSLLPVSKSWAIRMLVLDLWHGRQPWLSDSRDLPEDVRAAITAVQVWPKATAIEVGESGTLLRFLRMINWKRRSGKQFRLAGTLRDRQVADDPALAQRRQADLLELDGGTSQWASATALTGDDARLTSPPLHLAATYQAIDHWQAARRSGRHWELRRDATLGRQAAAWRQLQQTGSLDFQPQQPEDYVFARVFELITPAVGEQRWPSLRHHESDRITGVDQALRQYRAGQLVTSRDHRVVQAIAWRAAVDQRSVTFQRPQAVAKSWPTFWRFLERHAA